MVRSGHGVSIRELDNKLYATAMSQKMNSVPGYRTSAAFFTFLRANLALPSDEDGSVPSTPIFESFPTLPFPPVGRSSHSRMISIDSSDGDSTSSIFSSNESVQSYPSSATSYSSDDAWYRVDDEPTIEVLWMDRDKDAAIELIKTSVRQQKLESFKALTSHPLILAWWLVLSAVTSKLCSHAECGLVTTIAVVLVLSLGLLSGVYNACRRYDAFANQICHDWTRPEDIIIGARSKEGLQSTAVLRLENFPGRNKRRKTNAKALITAWTTKKDHRKKGVGKQVLEEAVRIARERAGNAVEIGFAAEHANSQFPLPELFIKGFRRNERMAASVLDGVLNGNGSDPRGNTRGRRIKRTRTF